MIKEKVEKLLDERRYRKIADLTDGYIRQIERQPRFNCLVRHMLESVRRMSSLTPYYQSLATKKGIGSPERLSRAMLKSHLNLLQESAEIDRLASPLQARGLMIICQDIPHIPSIIKNPLH